MATDTTPSLCGNSSNNTNNTSNVLWCWRELPNQMEDHDVSTIVGNSTDCLIRFESYESDALETAFQSGTSSIAFDGVRIDFNQMQLIHVGDGNGDGNGDGSSSSSSAQLLRRDVVRVLKAATLPAVLQPPLLPTDDDIPYNDYPLPVAPSAPPMAQAVLVTDSSTTTPAATPPATTTTNAVRWCWRETPSQMRNHPSSKIIGNPKECWISYDDTANIILEQSYQLQNGIGTCAPTPGYIVDFTTMVQQKLSTGFERDVQRLLVQDQDDGHGTTSTNSSSVSNNNIIWCWEETPSQMSSHSIDQIVGDPKDCWIRYDCKANDELESAYQLQNKSGQFTPRPGYIVNFRSMVQTKIATGFHRNVQCVDVETSTTLNNNNNNNNQRHRAEEEVCWCWEETSSQMSNHSTDMIVGDPSHCWIRYDRQSNKALECAYQSQNRKGTFTPIPGYTVDFTSMIQTKVATGYRRNVQRLVNQSAKATTTTNRNGPSYSNGMKCIIQNCLKCSQLIQYPETMTTPFIYCWKCCSAFPSQTTTQYHNRLSPYLKWSTCRCCGFYCEIKDFSRDVEIYDTAGDSSTHVRTERWSIHSCCRRCAKKTLFPGRMWGGILPNSRGISELGASVASVEAYEISHANGLLQKCTYKPKRGKGDFKKLEEAELTYTYYLSKEPCHSPDLNYSLYRARELRYAYMEAECAIEQTITDCGNYQPAIQALETLMQQRLKTTAGSSSSSPATTNVQMLEAQYKLVMMNCLGRDVSPSRKLQSCHRKVEIIWQRQPGCVIS